MALFKILKGKSDALKTQDLHEGYCYFTTDTGQLYIDTADERIAINADKAAIEENPSIAGLCEIGSITSGTP